MVEPTPPLEEEPLKVDPVELLEIEALDEDEELELAAPVDPLEVEALMPLDDVAELADETEPLELPLLEVDPDSVALPEELADPEAEPIDPDAELDPLEALLGNAAGGMQVPFWQVQPPSPQSALVEHWALHPHKAALHATIMIPSRPLLIAAPLQVHRLSDNGPGGN